MSSSYRIVQGPTAPATSTAAALYTNGTSGDVAVKQVAAIGATAEDDVSLWVVRSGGVLATNTTFQLCAAVPVKASGAGQFVLLLSEEFEDQGEEYVLAPGDAVFSLGTTGDCSLYVLAV